jgi:hypothetical protein
MATEGQGPAQAPALTSLPRVEDIPQRGDGLDPDRVREAFESYRRHATQLQVQLRVLQAAQRSGQVEPTGHAVRMDALHLIRAAAEMADTIERDAQTASASQLRRTEEEVSRRQRELQEREREIEQYRNESERERAEMQNTTKNEVRQMRADAERDATQEVREAEARAARLLEQSRHQATELTNAARAEVEQTLEWARAQAGTVMARAQEGAEQLLAAAGLGDDAMSRVVDSIVEASKSVAEASRPAPSAPPAAAEPAAEEPAAEEPPVSGPPPTSASRPEAEAGSSDDEDSGQTGG